MESQESYLQRPTTPKSSSSSAINLAGSPAGIVASAPGSPSLEPSGSKGSFSRRRTSWGQRLSDAGQDPLRLDPVPPLPATASSSSANTSSGSRPVLTDTDDFFSSPTDDRSFPFSARYGSQQMKPYSNAEAGPSSVSLVSTPSGSDEEHREDDEAHLTANEMYGGEDPERSAAMTPRSRRRTIRYSPSPLKQTGSAIKSMSHNIRRASVRVVNLASAGLESQLRLGGGEQVKRTGRDDDDDELLPDLSKALPIRGRTLGFFGPESKVRLALFNFLVSPWTEPIILVLIIVNAVVLTIQAALPLTLSTSNGTAVPPRIRGYFHSWEDYALFVLFIIFTLEAFARICVSGFLFDPEISMFSLFGFGPQLPSQSPALAGAPPLVRSRSQVGLNRSTTITKRFSIFKNNLLRPFTLRRHVPSSPYANAPAMSEVTLTNVEPPSHVKQLSEKILHVAHDAHMIIREPPNPTYLSKALRSDNDEISLPFRLSIVNAHDKASRNIPYLRQSWGRIDFIAITSFWITFVLATTGVERGAYHIGIFRAMSVIRTARLLTITTGTTTIMHSLKTARPLLTRVAYFVLFAMVLFSIIGVQSFKGSFRRTCVLNPTLGQDEIPIEGSFCGGHVDPVTLRSTGYILLDGSAWPTSKGFICPLGQTCKEQDNPANGVESFDAIWLSALQVVIAASANGWTPSMYAMIDTEYFFSCFFFIFTIIVLNFWLINLFVAVITNTFSAIRSETKKSAFGAAPLVPINDEKDDEWATDDGRKSVRRPNLAKTIYGYTRWCWVLLALASLALQASRSVDMTPMKLLILYYGELGITFAFDVEIVLRVLATLPDWRSFFSHGNNWLDLILAVGSSIIQIPAIRDSEVYPWFTIFQLARFYRVILVIPRMKPLLLAVFGNMYGLANMTLFLMMINYIAALASVQFLRGDMGEDSPIQFGDVWNAFLGVYQICSSENWTDLLYGATGAEIQLGQATITAIFMSCWLFFSNFIVLQMFIAVINENFKVAEESKKGQQASTYWASHNDAQKTHWLRRFNPYRFMKANPVKVKVEDLPANLVLPIQKSLVQDYTVPRYDPRSPVPTPGASSSFKPSHYSSKSLNALERLFAGDSRSNDIPMSSLRHGRARTAHDEETERHLELLASVNPEAVATQDLNDAMYERRAQKADFIRDHPSFDKTFWIFSQKNPLRRMCQKVVQPANGERIFGTPQSPIAHPIFQLILLLTVIGGIVTETIATPVYRRNYFIQNGLSVGAWFDVAEAAFGFLLVVEFLIKIIADGFIFTPNSYITSIWNILDFIIMVGILVNITTGLIFVGGLSRLTRSLKALRALRLITLIDRMRNTFQTLILSGAIRIVDAGMLAILYMIPYAVWGLNIFAGKMNLCNDNNVAGLAQCVGEYNNTVLGDSFGFPVPRVWDNPSPSTTFSFDTFKSSLLILFEIVSLEGWIDVMNAASSITGKDQQPETNSSPFNATFFVIYNLMGAVVILTLFVSIIIGNFSSKTGSAFLTTAQREWIDLQKLFKRQRPSKRPTVRPTNPIRSWCFDRAIYKNGWWSRLMTLIIVLHIIALMTQTFSSGPFADSFRNDFFLAIISLYLIDVLVRLFGLGWPSFQANGWNMFDIVVAGGSFITTLIVRFGISGFVTQQLQKLFLVSIAFKLVQKSNNLNMLFKTAVASLPVILNLLGLWIILFIFFAILFVEVFSLTKWGGGENVSQNFMSVGSALVMLAFMSVGEGWNQYMHDYTVSYPRCTNFSNTIAESDCGSEAWAFGVVVENFSYVFQTSAGGAKSITREQMRQFKKVWAEFANPSTGYLERDKFAPFFGKLSGAFEVKIYPTDYSIPNIVAVCKESQDPEMNWSSRIVHGVDLGKLEAILGGLDYAAIRKRRGIYSRLYHEANISHQQGRGISFNNMLILLAHHKLIVDGEALILKDLVVRTETNRLVTDLVNLDRVRSLLKTISQRRRFLAHKARLLEQQQQDIPSIIVDTHGESPSPVTPPTGSPYVVTASPESPTPGRRFRTPDVTLSLDLTAKLQRSTRRTSDISMLSMEYSYAPSQRSSMAEPDPQNVISSMENSKWGDLMVEAVEEDERT
ncbi:hypothetical protein H0H81_006278 [Sphagnurus paluster]|uniref:Calcium-channel protein CCH1 n=1 Tax=Sphagnurus paluster TaxID=117069 RepID=A0A9P7GRF3_9AGAR|nr:hypothetical protein H0H81_006278 [Sphagnurus paluster]